MSEPQLVYGLHAVRAVLEGGRARVTGLWLQQGRADPRIATLASLAEAAGIRPVTRPAAELDKLTAGAVHQGAVLQIEPGPPLHEDDLIELARRAGPGALLLALDGVQDPHNLGACLRTAEAAGVTAVLTPRDRAAGITPTVRKVAAGAAETMPFAQVTNLARTLRELKQLGLWIVGTDGAATTEFHKADLTGPTVVVMGAEGAGMRRLTRETCDLLVRLPMRGAVESLNVSVATGIMLYEILRQRTR